MRLAEVDQVWNRAALQSGGLNPGEGDLALHHARRTAAHIQQAGDLAADFDHAYVHEATARALACLGRLDEARAELELAKAVEIADPEDRAIVETDLKTEPWFGL